MTVRVLSVCDTVCQYRCCCCVRDTAPNTRTVSAALLSALQTFVLSESASGYGIFEVKEFDEISQAAQKLQDAVM